MAWYTMNDVAMMTGLTTRTLRNYLRQGLLKGEKVDGVWRFTEEEYEVFLAHPAVKPGLRAKKNAIVNDFMLLDAKKENQTCVILDFCMEREDAKRAAEFFCQQMKVQEDDSLQFGMEWYKKNMRVILSGTEAGVKEIMKRYYEGY